MRICAPEPLYYVLAVLHREVAENTFSDEKCRFRGVEERGEVVVE